MIMCNRPPYFFLLFVVLILNACAFSSLEDDLEKMEEVWHPFTGTVTADGLSSNAIVVVASRDSRGENIAGFALMYGGGAFEILLPPAPAYFFGFNDLNKDLRFQPGEPYGWAAAGQAIGVGEAFGARMQINISMNSSGQAPVPEELVGKALYEHIDENLSFSVGTVSSLDNPWFSMEQSKKGLWQPFAYMQDGGAGIHFLAPYDPAKIPVLFVHGINGSPRNFASLIENLDESRYQAWVYSYPSGLKLSWVAGGMAEFLEILHGNLQFDDLHIVAHSMGGLVSRGSINLCVQNITCFYLRSYTTISTPWNGVESARSGVKWAPTVVPVWRDLDPSSAYVTTLFDTPLPSQLPHHLLFGFRQKSIFGSESSDGVIKLKSQLRHAAQDQASQVHGYDEDHVSILSNELVMNLVYEILAHNARRDN